MGNERVISRMLTMIEFLKFIWHYREIITLLQDFSRAESCRLAMGMSANKEQWSRRVRRVNELGII